MDILTKHKVGSDLPLHEKQRKPIYRGKNSTRSFSDINITGDNLSKYVDKNLAKTVKPRDGEYR